mmetsp:Transcript_10741/g.35588  ORF Transcript_10741/g.35588 Transcript_10741/m.35588 type:complete len:363 (-) Transcript_10741:51-1139(-)
MLSRAADRRALAATCFPRSLAAADAAVSAFFAKSRAFSPHAWAAVAADRAADSADRCVSRVSSRNASNAARSVIDSPRRGGPLAPAFWSSSASLPDVAPLGPAPTRIPPPRWAPSRVRRMSARSAALARRQTPSAARSLARSAIDRSLASASSSSRRFASTSSRSAVRRASTTRGKYCVAARVAGSPQSSTARSTTASASRARRAERPSSSVAASTTSSAEEVSESAPFQALTFAATALRAAARASRPSLRSSLRSASSAAPLAASARLRSQASLAARALRTSSKSAYPDDSTSSADSLLAGSGVASITCFRFIGRACPSSTDRLLRMLSARLGTPLLSSRESMLDCTFSSWLCSDDTHAIY